MGVIYYKLQDRYEGDRTKGCGLTTAEMDENFHFLRGYDIKDAYFEDGILTLERVNCDKIVVEGIPEYVRSVADEALESYEAPINFDWSYDRENGTLTVIVNGETYTISGFLTEPDLEFKLYVGYGLDGKGTIANPVRLSHSNDTGFYAPVEKVLGIGEELPSTNISGRRRYVTTEMKSPYGLLYNSNSAVVIDEWLQENARGWRVPSMDDWSEMLNALECDDEFRNHQVTGETSENGDVAALYLKADEFDDDPELNDFKALPTKIDNVPEEVKETSYWSRTPTGDGGLYSKELIEGQDTVIHRNSGTYDNDWRAIRLVKDVEFNSFEDEEIGGSTYKTTTMRAYKDGEFYTAKIWLAENLRLTGIDGIETLEPPIVNEEDSIKPTTHYYINTWDPFERKWVKKELQENDIFIVNDFDGSGNSQEVIVKIDENGNQVLEPHLLEITDAISDLENKLEQEKSERETEDENLSNRIENLSASTESALTEEATERQEAIENLSAATENAINQEVTDRQEAISGLSAATQTAIEDLSASTESAIENLSAETESAITQEIADREAAVENLSAETKNAIDAEISARTEAVEALENEINALSAATQSAISQEVADRDLAITALSAATDSALTEEQEARISKDEELENKINELTSGTSENISGIEDRLDGIEEDIEELYDSKVDKEIGKGLSTNDYTNAEKAKLESLKIKDVKSGDTMLEVDVNGDLISHFDVTYDQNSKKILFTGKDGASLGFVDTTDFLIDGMLENVNIVTESGVTYLRFTFNTDAGSKVISIPLTDLVTVYTVADGTVSGMPDSTQYLKISDFQIAVRVGPNGLATERSVTDAVHALADEIDNRIDEIDDELDDINDRIGTGFTDVSITYEMGQLRDYVEQAIASMDESSGKIGEQVGPWPAGTNITTVLQDVYSKINGATIDSAITWSGTTIVNAGTPVTQALQNVVNKAANEDAALAREIESLKATDSATTQEINDLKAADSALTQEINDLKAVDSAITDTIEALDERAENLEDTTSALTDSVEDLESRLHAIEEEGSAIKNLVGDGDIVVSEPDESGITHVSLLGISNPVFEIDKKRTITVAFSTGALITGETWETYFDFTTPQIEEGSKWEIDMNSDGEITPDEYVDGETEVRVTFSTNADDSIMIMARLLRP